MGIVTNRIGINAEKVRDADGEGERKIRQVKKLSSRKQRDDAVL